jgi:hypothetical protein
MRQRQEPRLERLDTNPVAQAPELGKFDDG